MQRRWLSLLISVLALLLAGGADAMPDTNGDGRIDVRDVQLVVNRILGAPAPATFPQQGDANGDGSVDVVDVQVVVGEILQLPAQLSLPQSVSVPQIITGQQYAFNFSAMGGQRPLAWSHSGSMPAGFHLTSDGLLSGYTNQTGQYQFTIVVSDANNATATASVSVWAGSVNYPPVANDDSFNYAPGVVNNYPAPGVLANDTDANGHTLTASLVSPPAFGTLTLNPNGSFSFQSTGPAFPPVTFVYMADDGFGGTDTATVTLTGVNSPPIAVNDQYTTPDSEMLVVPAPGVLANDTDPDGHDLTAVLISPPQVGSLTLRPDGSFDYEPLLDWFGMVRFTYSATDGYGGVDSAEVWIWVHREGESGVLGEFRVSPSPVLHSSPVTVIADIFDPTASHPTQVGVTSVTLSGPGLPVGGVPMSVDPVDSYGRQIRYRANQTAPTAWGLHQWVITVNHATLPPLVREVSFLVYTSQLIMVGPLHMHTTIASGLAACPSGGCVLVESGVYNEHSLTLTGTRMLVGEEGMHKTAIDIQGSLNTAFTTLGPTRATILAGIEVRNGQGRFASVSESFTLFQCRITDFVRFFDNGGALLLDGATSQPLIRESVFSENLAGEDAIQGVTVPVPANAPGLWGGAIAAMNDATPELIRTTFRANRSNHPSHSLGGAIYRPTGGANTMVIDRCRFLDNISRSGLRAVGGAIAVDIGSTDISRTEFRRNLAICIPVPVNEGSQMSVGSSDGGVLSAGYVNFGATPLPVNEYSRVRWVDCLFELNQAIAPHGTRGGALYLHLRSIQRATNCQFISNSTEQAGNFGMGGAINVGGTCYLKLENCILEGNQCNGPNNARRGGAIANNPSPSGTPVLVLHNCRFINNRARWGGAIGCFGSSAGSILLADQCLFEGNVALGDGTSNSTSPRGGAVHQLIGSHSWFDHCIFRNNMADGFGPQATPEGYGGGAISADHSSNVLARAVLRNCLFDGNTSTNAGGAIWTRHQHPTVPNPGSPGLEVEFCTFVNNQAAPGLGDAIFSPVRPVYLRNSILFGQDSLFLSPVGEIHNSCIDFPVPAGWAATGKITTPPQFVSGPLGTSYLSPTSPCIDAGDLFTLPANFLDGMTTQSNESPDFGFPDVGFHYPITTQPVVPRTPIDWQTLPTLRQGSWALPVLGGPFPALVAPTP